MSNSNLPLADQWYRCAVEWGELESAASLLEESKSSFLSQLMVKEGDIPVSKAELRAKASPEWNNYITKMVEARTAANLAKIEMEYRRMKVFEEQSRAATERVQARL